MRLLISVCIFTLVSCLSFASHAQDKWAQDKAVETQADETQTSKSQPIEKTAKPSGEDRSKKVEAEDNSFDMDSFFKQGEDNAKTGHGCGRSPEPIS